jgi:hypothetical protein
MKSIIKSFYNCLKKKKYNFLIAMHFQSKNIRIVKLNFGKRIKEERRNNNICLPNLLQAKKSDFLKQDFICTKKPYKIG